MKVILLQSVKSIGSAGDVKDVSSGYFRNFLLPARLAKPASSTTLQEAEAIKKRILKEAVESRTHAQAMAERLSKELVTLTRKATSEGQLFGSVSGSDIADALVAKGYAGIQAEFVHVDAPIKSIGAHSVKFRLMPDLEGAIQVMVEKGE